MGLIVEVAYCLKIEQRIYSPTADVVLGIIHFPPDTGAPGGNDKSQPDIQRDGSDRNSRIDETK